MSDRARKILLAVFAAGFLFGLGVLFYPLLSNLWNGYVDSIRFQKYDRTAQTMTEAVRDGEWDKADAYNASLTSGSLVNGIFAAETGQQTDAAYDDCLNTQDDGMMGYLEIPKIDAEMAIYHTTSDEVLQKGAGHVYGSSLPTGGASTHCVIAAHRGLPGQSLFTDLDQVEVGDTFYIHVLDEVHAYEVDQIRVVLPENVDGLNVTGGEDYVTLVTCTPYAVNSHRLLVRGHRVPYEEGDEDGAQAVHTIHTNYWLWIIIGLAVTAAVILIAVLLSRHIRRKKNIVDGSDK